MRATLHLTSARDFTTLRLTLQPVMTDAMRTLGTRAEGLELDELLPATQQLLDERPRNFDELRGLLSQRFPDVNDNALGYGVRMNLLLVTVPTDDR